MILVALMGSGNKETVEKPEPPKAAPEKLIANPIVEKAIRKHLKKLKEELTEADLEKVTKLLSYGVSPLTDVKGLEKLTQLKELHLPNNQLTDVKSLEKLTQLTYLDLSNNQLTDVKGLEKLTQLTYLSFYWNPKLTKAQIDQLQKALPKCEIIHNAKK